MPYNGQMGTAKDGTQVVWMAATHAAVPVAQARSMGWKPPAPAGAPAKEDPVDRKRVGDMATALGDVNMAAGAADDFGERNAKTGTGGWLGIPGVEGLAKAMPWTSPDLGQMDRDSVQIANRLRAPGMRMTQMEFQKFLGASPSTKNTGDKNSQMIQNVRNARTMASAQTAFYDKWLQVRGDLHGADAAWMNYQNTHFKPDGTWAPPQAPGQAAANGALKAKSGRTGPVLLGYEGQ